MQFLVISQTQPDADPAASADLLPAEAAGAWRLYADGAIRQAYLSAGPDTKAVLIVEAAAERDVQQLFADMPLVRAGLIRLEITAIGPFVAWAALMPAEQAA